MRIYMDMCCYNRPYDPQEQLKISLEAKAKLHIQRLVEEGKVELIGSYTLDYESSNVPFPMRRKAITDFIASNICGYVGGERSEIISKKAEEIMKTNVKERDAYHVASAIYAKCDYFISTDTRLLKYKTNEIKMVNPIQFITEMEDD